MESEQMYGDKGEVPDGEYTIPLELLISNEGTDVTRIFEKSSKKRTLLLTSGARKRMKDTGQPLSR
jgi:pyruvate/2-oxoglutarate/acetoin dehydrogenase E1 component